MDTKSADLAQRKAVGKQHLEANRIEQAIQVFAQILREYPADIESYLILGDCYLADGDPDTALAFYTQAQQLDPQDSRVLRRINLAQVEVNLGEGGKTMPLAAEMTASASLAMRSKQVADLLERLANRPSAISEADVQRAAKLLEEILHSPHPALKVAERLDEIDELIPALLELNIRQARQDGREDLAIGLENLLQNIYLQKEVHGDAVESLTATTSELAEEPLRILWIDPLPDLPLIAPKVPIAKLSELDCQFVRLSPNQVPDLKGFDVVLAVHPHGDPGSMEWLAAAHGAKLPILLYLEADFEQIPLQHPAFELVGLNNPARAKAYSAACWLADRIVVPSEAFANTLRQANFQVTVIPPAWDTDDLSNSKPVRPRHTLNIGWIGLGGELEDVFQVKRMIVRVLREFPHVRLVIAGDVEVYQLFDSLPESRRIFLPIIEAEDYWYALKQMDVLLLPLRNTPFNNSLSEKRLMDAGGRGIPWLASPSPAAVNWASGGLIAHSLDEWHTYLRQLVLDNDLRVSLGNAGGRQVQLRSLNLQSRLWYHLLRETIHGKKR
ncbi:MAG: Glycosyl transferase, group 1 [Anaerolineae bacterium]|jgi:glycosyltransferase involved in cell wall biosynthesis|nr:MAG: Glycosyl transferase, group 1 [Anaerolineae bacterium]